MEYISLSCHIPELVDSIRISLIRIVANEEDTTEPRVPGDQDEVNNSKV